MELYFINQFSLSKWQRSTLHRRGHRGHRSGAAEHWERIVMTLLREHIPWMNTHLTPPKFVGLKICKLASQLYRNKTGYFDSLNLNLKPVIIQEGSTHGQQKSRQNARFSTSLFSSRKASIIRCRMDSKCKESQHCCVSYWEHPSCSLPLFKERWARTTPKQNL